MDDFRPFGVIKAVVSFLFVFYNIVLDNSHAVVGYVFGGIAVHP